MKIFNNPNITKVMQTYTKNSKPIEKMTTGQRVSDKIEISQKAKEFQLAMKAFKKLPEVREEKIKELQEQIDNGSYNVSGKEVADKIMEGLMIDKKL